MKVDLVHVYLVHVYLCECYPSYYPVDLGQSDLNNLLMILLASDR